MVIMQADQHSDARFPTAAIVGVIFLDPHFAINRSHGDETFAAHRINPRLMFGKVLPSLPLL
jgi:hypothetical protein